MLVWVLYDIDNDRARQKVAKACQQAGLYRVQLSCFLGTLSSHEKDVLQLQLTALMDEERDKVYLFPMNKAELQQTVLLGRAFDKALVSAEVRNLFF